MLKIFQSSILKCLLLTGLVGALYGQFLYNPIVFDDQGFFTVDAFNKQPIDGYSFKWLELRSLPYATLAWTKAAFGLDVIHFRIGALLLHASCVVAVFIFSQLVLNQTHKPKNQESLTANQAAFLIAALYAVHPMAVYAAGYLIQRTIVMATLFSLLAMVAYAKGTIQNKAALSWCALPFYYLAVYSKEHAIMLVPVLAALTILLHEQWPQKLKQNALLFAALTTVSLMVLATRSQMFGSVYEIDAPNMLGLDYGVWSHPLSILTQCGLFFKYVILWLLPDTARTSIDMRETFQRSFISWHVLFIPAYIAWGLLSIWLLLKRGAKGLVGFSMFFPWILFMTEFFSVRIQEPFVLYRSYLWASAGFLFIPAILNGINRKMIGMVSVAVVATYFVLSMERLVTFSDGILLWSDAKQLVEKKPLQLGSERIYYNLGRNFYMNDQVQESELNLRKAIQINPEFANAYGVLGAVFVKQQRWDEAIAQYNLARKVEDKLGNGHSFVYLAGRAKAYEGAGKGQLAIQDYLEACRINLQFCETLRKSATPID